MPRGRRVRRVLVQVEVLLPALLRAVAGERADARAARGGGAHLHHRRARGLDVGEASGDRLHRAVGLAVARAAGEVGRQVADPLALQRVLVQRRLVVGRPLLARVVVEREQVVRVGAGGGVEDPGDVGGRARQRTREVLQPRQRHHARAGRDAVRAPEGDQGGAGGGRVERDAGLAAHAEAGEAGRDGHRAAAGAAQRRLRRLERVPHHAVAGLAVGAGVGELGQVALAEDDRPRLAQLLHLEGVALGLPAFEREAAVRGRHVLGVVEVLHDDRHAEQVALDARGALGVGVSGLRHRVLGHRDEGVEAELALVVGLDPVQVGARDRLRGRQAGVHVGHHLRDRLVDHVVAGRRGLEARLRDARQRRERRVRAVLAREREVRDRAQCGGRETGEVGRGRQAGRAGRDHGALRADRGGRLGAARDHVAQERLRLAGRQRDRVAVAVEVRLQPRGGQRRAERVALEVRRAGGGPDHHRGRSARAHPARVRRVDRDP